ncbi:unnamed protein product [Closterium sp. Yama58-4]|nr:unnamed protein product [Closterium sp. Yama58-4]
MASGRRTGRGGGKTMGVIQAPGDSTPPPSTEHSPEKSPLVSAQASPVAPPKGSIESDVAKTSLQERLSALKVNGLKDKAVESDVVLPSQPGMVSAEGSDPALAAPVVSAKGKQEAAEEEWWDSDDEDDFDPVAINALSAQISFSITLLVPIEWEAEVPKLKATVVAHLDFWKASLTADAQTTTQYQVLLPAFLSKKKYHRLQVTFQQARDAEFAWMWTIEHDLGKGATLKLDWQHPENAAYKQERRLNPGAVEVVLKSLELLLIAAYLPAQPENRAPFYRDCLGPFLSGLPDLKNVLVMGDFNVVEDSEIDKSTVLGSAAENRRLMSFWARTPLTDVFRYVHPGKREYTFHAKGQGVSTRIDRALLSQPLLCKLVDARHKAITKKMTDHWNAVMAALEFSTAGKKGLGIWRLRAAQAKTKGVRERVKKVLRDTGGDLAEVLPRLSSCLRAYSREERKRVKEVEVFRSRLSQKPRCQRTGAILLKKEELLNAYEKYHMENLQAWAGIKSELDGEATSSFLSGKVKTRKAKTEVHEVKLKGKVFTGAREILVAATEFFQDSFGGDDISDGGVVESEPLGRTISEASKEALSAPWSEEEVRTAVRELASGKSPGQDGLPKELFEHNWDLLGPVLMQFATDFTRTLKLPSSVSTAVTILLHKKGSKEDLGNYRPITLLSTVYKILAKVLATRLKKVLHEVISEDQVGFLPGRKLADAVTVVADAIEAGVSGREDWYLLMIDFRKAFDSISRPFLFRTLRRMGIPEEFVSWAEGLHRETGTRVHVNGWTGDMVAVKKGVRQGCPLAPFLFLCAVKPLCQELTKCKLGIGRRGIGKLAYLGYADDTSLLLRGAEQVSVAAGVLDEFGEKSGLQVNRDKTVLFPLGKNRGKPPPPDLQYKWADKGEPERLLGVWITPNGDPLPSWEKALDRARKELAKWEVQHLTTSARVTIVNGYITPIFLFQAYIYPPPKEIWTKIQRICHRFVSGGQATDEKVFILWNYELMCTPREEGGLGLICPKKRFDSVAIQNIGRMMLQDNPVKKWLTECAAAMPQGEDTIFTHKSLIKHWKDGSRRWKEMLQVFWDSPFCVSPEPTNRWEAERERLAFNRRIPFRGASPFGNQKGSACLLGLTMGDLVQRLGSGERILKTEEALTRELGNKDAAKLALKAFAAAPAEWRNLILEKLTSEEVVEKVPLLRCQGRAPTKHTMWKVSGTDGDKVVGKLCVDNGDGTVTACEGDNLSLSFRL